MGQYQEWLHYREVDQQLQAQLETLERELAQLQEHAHLLEQGMGPPRYVIPPGTLLPPGDQVFLQVDNQIIHALASSLNGHLSSPPALAPETAEDAPHETISSALFAWSNLPNFGPQEVPVEALKADHLQANSGMDQPPAVTPHSEMALLPEDMAAFFDQHDQTEPQLEIPRWLRNITHANHPDGPIDRETMRTNRLVQRWVERWGRLTADQEKTEESQNEYE
jgi:hypothetical protein